MFKNSNNKKAIAIIASFLIACGFYAWYLENLPWGYAQSTFEKDKLYGTYLSVLDRSSMILIFEDDMDHYYHYTASGESGPNAYKGTLRKIADRKYIFTDPEETEYEVTFDERNFSLEFGKDSNLIFEKSDIARYVIVPEVDALLNDSEKTSP